MTGVPDFQSLMLPLLHSAADGEERSLAATRSALADKLGLSQAEQDELLPSGRVSRFANRVAWAKVYLQQAGILSSSRRGHFQITDRGRQILEAPPDRIDIGFLGQYPEFVQFRSRKGGTKKADPDPQPTGVELETPEEAFETAHAQMRSSLAAELLQKAKTGTPAFFEHLVLDLLLKMGYGDSRSDAGQVVGQSGDEGIDGIISEDRLGLDLVYLQAKRWEGVVGRPEIQKFVGALHGKRAKKGVFITTSAFSSNAVEYIEKIDPRVVLIDGERLADLMVDFNVGVLCARTFEVKRLDSDYFEDS